MPRTPNCALCSLHLNARTVCCWGEQRRDGELAFSYSRKTEVMIVGEAPGAQEDVAGRPFIGPSGGKLKEALDANGLRDFYVTNVAKCVSNGPPSSTQVAACRPYLVEEIEQVKPKFILALGNTAVHAFMKGKITEIAGKETWSDKYQCWVFPALHPSAILRNPNNEAGWRADIARFAMLVRGELVDKPPVETQLVLTKTDMISLQHYLRTRPFTYDFETPMLPWWDKTWKPLTIAFGFRQQDGSLQGWTVPLGYPGSGVDREALKWFLGEMIPIMSDPTRPKSAHNAIFDDLCWYRLTGQLPWVTCDTMVLAHLLDENRLKSLKYLGRALLGWPQWDIDARQEHPLDRLAEYNAYDAAATLMLREKLLAELQQQPRLFDYFTRLEMPKVRAVERLIARGVYVDRARLDERCAQATTTREDILSRLPIENPASTPQLRAWLYGTAAGASTKATTSKATTSKPTPPALRLSPPHLTPKGSPSTDEDAIKRLVQRYPEHAGIRTLLEWRKQNKFLTTYLTPSCLSLENSFDGRIHPEYRSTSVETGRLGSSFHTTPRDNFIRSIYTAPAGYSLISADYSQIEARLAAWSAAGKPATVISPAGSTHSTMLAAWYTGRDVYVEQAAAILNKRPDQVTRDPEDPQNERQMMGKVPVLSMLYAISAKGLQEYVWKEFEIDWTRSQAQRCWDGFYNLWPEFKRWHDLMRTKILSDGYTLSECGRYRRLPAALYGDWKAQDEAVRAGINAPIQTLAMEILVAAMILLDADGKQIVGSIHDAVLVEEEDAKTPATVLRMTQLMEAAHLALQPMGLCLPHGLIKVEIKVGAWGEGKTIKDAVQFAGMRA